MVYSLLCSVAWFIIFFLVEFIKVRKLQKLPTNTMTVAGWLHPNTTCEVRSKLHTTFFLHTYIWLIVVITMKIITINSQTVSYTHVVIIKKFVTYHSRKWNKWICVRVFDSVVLCEENERREHDTLIIPLQCFYSNLDKWSVKMCVRRHNEVIMSISWYLCFIFFSFEKILIMIITKSEMNKQTNINGHPLLVKSSTRSIRIRALSWERHHKQSISSIYKWECVYFINKPSRERQREREQEIPKEKLV